MTRWEAITKPKGKLKQASARGIHPAWAQGITDLQVWVYKANGERRYMRISGVFKRCWSMDGPSCDVNSGPRTQWYQELLGREQAGHGVLT